MDDARWERAKHLKQKKGTSGNEHPSSTRAARPQRYRGGITGFAD